MNEKNSQVIEQINAIKMKLVKYSSLKSYDKVNEYLHNLSRFQLNDEILMRTEIMNLLKDLKNKEIPAYSTKAYDLIKKIKNDLISKSTKQSNNMDSSNKSMPNTKQILTKSSVTSKLNDQTKSLKPNVNQSTVKKESYSNGSSTKSISNNNNKKPIDKNNSSNNSVKKRPSVASNANDNIKMNLDESLSKKPKLSLSDYKLLKGDPSDSFKSDLNNDNRGSTSSSSSSSSSQYEIESNLNLYDSYSPTPKNILNESKSIRNYNNSRPGSNLDDNNIKKEKKIIQPPVPSVPLTNILSAENKLDPFEPIRSSNSITNSNSNYSSTGMKNSISKFTSSLMNNSSKVDNGPSTDDMLAQIMKQKGSHKQILYTGKRTNGQSAHVSKLYDMCAKVLTDTLDELPNRISIYNTTHDFPIAFELIKPVLERANARQLENCELYSPNLLSETDYIWQKICEREFRKLEPPEEDESWRELYFRKLDEREREFERARRLISSKQQAKPKERQTQLATVKFVSANRSVRNVKTESSSTIRIIPSDSGSSFRKPSGGSNIGTGSSRFGPPQPPMSQGRKAIMKLIKKSTRR